MEGGDTRAAWAAYKSGSLPIDGVDEAVSTLQGEHEVSEPKAFRMVFEDWVLENFDFGWALLCRDHGPDRPAGLVFGCDVHRFVYVGSMLWMPWASARNRYESLIAFVNGVRWEMPIQWFTSDEEKGLSEAICKHGIARRVGTSHHFDGKQALFEALREVT